MARYEAIYRRIAALHASVGTSEETTLQLPQSGGDNRREVWLLVSFHYVRTGGTAASYQPRIGQSAAFSASGVEERVAYSSTLVGTKINDVYATPIPCLTDANGRLYFRPGFNAGSDNTGAYEFWFQKARGS
tara:strand:+ start:209 stop:604 length:396 start_codon:yes stop_codon:yes gene_type:complete